MNPRLGRGSVTNQEAPEANATAEWKTTSPATTNPRSTSAAGRRPPAGGKAGQRLPGGRPCGSRRRDQLARWSRIDQIGLTSPWIPAAAAVGLASAHCGSHVIRKARPVGGGPGGSHRGGCCDSAGSGLRARPSGSPHFRGSS